MPLLYAEMHRAVVAGSQCYSTDRKSKIFVTKPLYLWWVVVPPSLLWLRLRFSQARVSVRLHWNISDAAAWKTEIRGKYLDMDKPRLCVCETVCDCPSAWPHTVYLLETDHPHTAVILHDMWSRQELKSWDKSLGFMDTHRDPSGGAELVSLSSLRPHFLIQHSLSLNSRLWTNLDVEGKVKVASDAVT